MGKIISASGSGKVVMSCLAAISPDYPFGVFPEELLVRLVKNATSTAQYLKWIQSISFRNTKEKTDMALERAHIAVTINN